MQHLDPQVAAMRTPARAHSLAIVAWLIVALIAVLWTVRVLAYPLIYQLPLPIPAFKVIDELLRWAIWVLPVIVALREFEHVPLAPALALNRFGDWTQAWPAAIGVFAMALITLVALFLTAGLHFENRAPLAWIGFVVMMPLAPLAEEILCRGYLLRRLTPRSGFWVSNVVTAVVFTGMHWPGWLLLFEPSMHFIVQSSLGIFLLGLLFGWARERSGSLWPAVFLHSANNLLLAIWQPVVI